MLEMFQSSTYQTESGMMTALQSHLALNFQQGQVNHERIALIKTCDCRKDMRDKHSVFGQCSLHSWVMPRM